ncbi:MAG: hypothetical protein ACFFG0_52730 [Candidatus Thorarchaeota archaeon]
MKTYQKTMLLSLFGFILLLSVSSIVIAETGTTTVSARFLDTIPLSGTTSSGSFTSDLIIDVFITDMNGIAEYTSAFNIPSGALWSTSERNGSWSSISISFGNYIVFGNPSYISSATVNYQIISNQIPGFEMIYVFFVILIIGPIILSFKKKILSK